MRGLIILTILVLGGCTGQPILVEEQELEIKFKIDEDVLNFSLEGGSKFTVWRLDGAPIAVGQSGSHKISGFLSWSYLEAESNDTRLGTWLSSAEWWNSYPVRNQMQISASLVPVNHSVVVASPDAEFAEVHCFWAENSTLLPNGTAPEHPVVPVGDFMSWAEVVPTKLEMPCGSRFQTNSLPLSIRFDAEGWYVVAVIVEGKDRELEIFGSFVLVDYQVKEPASGFSALPTKFRWGLPEFPTLYQPID